MDSAAQSQAIPRVRVPSWHTLGLVLLPFLVLGLVNLPARKPGATVSDFSVASRYPYALTGIGDPSKEIAFYQRRLKSDPADASMHAALAELYLRQARMTSDPSYLLLAEKAARTSLDFQGLGNSRATIVVARLAEARQDYASALSLAQSVLRQEHQEDAAQIEIHCLLHIGRLQEAAAELMQLEPSTTNLAWQALVREDQGDEQGVADCIRQALSREKAGDLYGSAWSRTMFGRYFFRHGRYTLARDFCREAVRIFPTLPLALQQLADMETAVGEWDSAEKHYAEAYNVAPSATYLIGKARVRRLRGDEATATDLEGRAEAMLRGDLQSRRELACLLLSRQHGDDVTQAVAILGKDVCHRHDWLTLDAYAWSLQAAHREKEALDVENQALACGIHSAQLLYRKSELEDTLGMKDAAAQDRMLALQYNPNYPTAHAAVPFML